MKYIKLLIVSQMLLIIGFFSSCNYLDVSDYFDETLKYDSIFATKRNLEKYMWGTANYFPEEGDIFGSPYTPGPFATDEGFTLLSTSEAKGMSYVLGEVSPANLQGMDIWTTMYKIIRKANTILNRMNEARDLEDTDKKEIIGYTHFIRGYAYYHLLMQYGPVVLLGDDVFDTNEDPVYYNRSRATYDESVDYICQELELAAKSLPVTVPISLFGRPTRDAAYGLIARVRLQQASPLFNGKSAARSYFGDWVRSTDGVHYISQTYDEKKWAVAAFAAKRIMDFGRYSLYTVARATDTNPLPSNVSAGDFPYGAGNIDPFRSYSDMFTGEAVVVRNPEFIWARYSDNIKYYSRYSFDWATMGGANCFSVTQKVVDAYCMEDGKTTDHSSAEYPYSATGFSGVNKTFSGYQLKNTVSKMYVNREMRFYASIGFSECYWSANSTSDGSKKAQVITYSTDGTSGKNSTTGEQYPITGYVIKKFIHADDAWSGDNAQRINKPFPIIRYAEILLSYAEALNNLTTSHTIVDENGMSHTFSRNTDEIRNAFDQVRYRAGQPGLTDEEVNSAETMQTLIERERMVEFLFENRRYYDVRRWGIYETSEKEPMMGMNTNATKSDYYTVVPINHSKARNRVVNKKMVFLPISLTELRKASMLDQNPGWAN